MRLKRLTLAALMTACRSLAVAPARIAVEDMLTKRALPLPAAPSSAAASESLRMHGVARLDGVLEAATCKLLKRHIFDLRDSAADPTSQRWAIWMGAADNRYVPGSRVKFCNALEERLTAERSDILLPLEDAVVADALRTAATALRPVLHDGTGSLPTQANGLGEGDDGEGGGGSEGERVESLEKVELVECGALVAMPGSSSQALHADFRRKNVLVTSDGDGSASDRPAMPPRLVAFVYLQDVVSSEHGPTVFLPGTATAAAHDRVLDGGGGVRPGSVDSGLEWMATVRAGDAVVYDASVLHFGSANTVEGNDRAVFYFGISRAGHADCCAGPPVEGWEPVDPVRLWDYL